MGDVTSYIKGFVGDIAPSASSWFGTGGDSNVDYTKQSDYPDGDDTGWAIKLAHWFNIKNDDSTISSAFKGLQSVSDALGDVKHFIMAPTGYHAEKFMVACVEGSGAFDTLATTLKLPAKISGMDMATGTYLKKTCEGAVKNLIDGSDLPSDKKATIEWIKHVHNELVAVVHRQLDVANNLNTPERVKTVHPGAVADTAVAGITGLDATTMAVLDDKELTDDEKVQYLDTHPKSGLLAMVFDMQTATSDPNFKGGWFGPGIKPGTAKFQSDGKQIDQASKALTAGLNKLQPSGPLIALNGVSGGHTVVQPGSPTVPNAGANKNQQPAPTISQIG